MKKLFTGLLALLLLLLIPSALADGTQLQVNFIGMYAMSDGSYKAIPLSGDFDVQQNGVTVATISVSPDAANVIDLETTGNVVLMPVMETMPEAVPVSEYGYAVSVVAGRLNIAPIVAYADAGLFTVQAGPGAVFALWDDEGICVLEFYTDSQGFYALDTSIPAGVYTLVMTDSASGLWLDKLVQIVPYTGLESITRVDEAYEWVDPSADAAPLADEPTSGLEDLQTPVEGDVPPDVTADQAIPEYTEEPTESLPAAIPEEATQPTPAAEPAATPTVEPTAAPTATPTVAPTPEPTATSTPASTAVPTHGTLMIEMKGNGGEIAYSVSVSGGDAVEGTFHPQSPALLEGLNADDYIISLTIPEDAVLVSLNGYPTIQREMAQWMASVEAMKESLYVVEVVKTGAVQGVLENMREAVSITLKSEAEKVKGKSSDTYSFENLVPGIYTATIILPPGRYTDDADGAIAYVVQDEGYLGATMKINVKSADTVQLPTISRIVEGGISGTVTGLKGEALSGIGVSVIAENGDEVASASTGKDGAWAVDALDYGKYTIRYAAPKGTVIPDGSVTLTDESYTAELIAKAADPASITIFAFIDSNNNGTQGNNEKPLKDVEISLVSTKDKSIVATGITGKDGYVTLQAPAGEYRIRATLPEDYGFGKMGTAMRFAHSIMNESTSRTQDSKAVTISRSADTSVGIGAEPMAKVTGFYWLDVNGDGYWQADEPGIAGARVQLRGVRNGSEYEVTTQEDGSYTFSQLKTGSYEITYHVPDGYVFTVKSSGDIARRSRMTTEANREDSERFEVDRGDVEKDRNIGLMKETVIDGVCFLDANYNGIYDEGEKPLAGVELKLSRQSNNVLLRTAVSDKDGYYRFDGLRGSTFGIRALLPLGSTFTIAVPKDPNGNWFEPNDGKRERKITDVEADNSEHLQVMLGAIRYGSLSGTVYYDDNFSSVRENGERAASNVTVTLIDANGKTVATARTDRNGLYQFENLAPGDYRIRMTPVSGYAFTKEGAGSIVLNQEDGEGLSRVITVVMGDMLTNQNIGLIEPATVSGVVFADANDNGLYDKNEKGLRGTVIKLMQENGEAASTTVDSSGKFSFNALMPGEYYLRYELPENAVFAPRVDGGNAIVGDGNIGAGDWFTLKVGGKHTSPVCGGLDLGVISGLTFMDGNGNGLMDEEEQLLAGVEIVLTPTREDLQSFHIITDENGAFLMENLRPDTYTLTVICPENRVLSRMPKVSLGLKNGLAEQTVKLTVGMGSQWTEQMLGCVAPSSWHGEAYYDANENGVRDEGDAPAGGETILLRDADSGESIMTVQTMADGTFAFEGVAPGEYILAFTLGNGALEPVDGDSSFTVTDGEAVSARTTIQENTRYEGELLSIIRETSLGGKVWLDQAGDAVPVADAVIVLLDGSGTLVGEAVTDAEGAYEFNGLMPGDYTIEAMVPDGHALVDISDPRLADRNLISILQHTYGAHGTSGTITVEMAQHQQHLDIGCVLPGRLGDRVWLDLNGNGLQDGDEDGIPGVVIELLRNGEVVATTTSDQYGYYVLENLYPCEYIIRATFPAEVVPTQLRQDIALIVSVLQADGTSIPVMVLSNASNYNADLGFILVDEKHLPAGYGEGAQQDWTFKN